MPDITAAVFENIPVFLQSCLFYYQYLARGHIDLSYPPYEKNADGEIMVIPGEVFCRVHDCKNGRSPISSTKRLRHHLRGQHGYNVEERKKGTIPSAEQAAICEWFEQLIKNQGKKKNGVRRNKHEDEGKGKGKGKGKVEDKDVVQEEEQEDGDENECY